MQQVPRRVWFDRERRRSGGRPACSAEADIVAETERLLSVRRRNLVLGPEMLAVYDQLSWRQRSAIVRSWMRWATVLSINLCFFNLLYLPDLIVQNILVCCIGMPMLNAAAYLIWRKPRHHRLEGASIVTWCALTMLQMSLLGVLAGGYNHERYATGALFVVTVALMVVNIRFSWAKILTATILAIFLVAGLFNPLVSLIQAVALFCFYSFGVGTTLFARRTATLLSHEAFLMRLRDRHRGDVLAEANRTLEKLASTDPLTGLSNRRAATIEIQAAWSDPSRRGRGFAILMGDLDHFKALNDSRGHAVGDDCLRQVAGAIRLAVDPEHDIVVRFGGEEFLVCLCDVDDRSAAEAAERIRASVEALAIANPGAPGGIVTMSLGLAPALAEATHDMATLWADEALYQAKQQGRNRVVTFAGNLAVLAAHRPATAVHATASPSMTIGASPSMPIGFSVAV